MVIILQYLHNALEVLGYCCVSGFRLSLPEQFSCKISFIDVYSTTSVVNICFLFLLSVYFLCRTLTLYFYVSLNRRSYKMMLSVASSRCAMGPRKHMKKISLHSCDR